MADITSTIRFIADASQAISTMRGLATEAQALNQSINNVQRGIIAQQTGAATPFARNSREILKQNLSGQLVALPPTTQIDQFNKTLRTTYDTLVLDSQGNELFRASLSNTNGDIREIEKAIRTYSSATFEAGSAQQVVNNQLENARASYQNIRREILESAAANRQATAQRLSEVRAEQASIIQQQEALAARPTPRSGSQARRRAQLQQDLDDLLAVRQAEERALLGQQSIQRAQALEALKTDPLLVQSRERIAQLEQLKNRTVAAAADVVNAAEAGINRAIRLPSPLPASLETVRQESPKLFNRLAGQGLLGNAPGQVDIKRIYESGADQLQLTRDLERGTTQLRGSIRGLNGELINVNAAYAEGGRVIGRYGGALSGVQNFLRQTVNNFQKVVQWGLATTAVFTGLAVAGSAVNTIKNLDASLNQLSITAQLSSRQTKDVFADLAQIAHDTSTPLEEMVKAADDIALATKRANQSTQEWQANIKSLATSVGVLTNITGLDTVRATDLLTSTMKQLNLQAKDIPTILNKIAAVAGGQANAIQDVVSGLGAMAEASQQANLTIDQTIATVQVLGQVTSKSSTEVATAFKNLVGSVDSAGAQKAFEKYNISIKDSEGNLRNILDIYGEINDKIRSGVIPESDVKALVKAIAGGPRRAPDAAALLANVDAIRQATEVAKNATNEAAVANAKYLDTIESKLIQLQVKFQTFIQQVLAPQVKSFVTDLVNVISGLIDIIQRVPPGLIHAAASFTALIVAVKAFSGLTRFLVGGIRDIVAGFRLVNAAAAAGTNAFKITGSTAQISTGQILESSVQQTTAIERQIIALQELAAAAKLAGNAQEAEALQAAIAAQQNARSAAITAEAAAAEVAAAKSTRFGGLNLGGLAKGVGGAAVIGGGLSLLTGASPANALSNAGLAAGLQLAVSAPIPQLKLLGAAIAGVSVLLGAFTQDNHEAAQSEKELKTEILSTIEQLNQAQASAANLTHQQSDLLQLYRTQSAQSKGTPEDINALQSTVEQYVQASFDLKAANEQVAASFKALNESIPNLSDKFKNEIGAAQQGILSTESLAKLQQKIYEEIFSNQYPDVFKQAGSQVPDVKPQIVTSHFLPSGSTQFTDSSGIKRDLEHLQNATEVLNLFDVSGKKLVADFDLTAKNADLITNALKEASNESGNIGIRAREALKTFTAIVGQADLLGQTDIFLAKQDALLTTKSLLKQINSDELQQGRAVEKVYRDIMELASQLPSRQQIYQDYADFGTNPTPRLKAGTTEDVQKLAQNLLLNPNGTIRTKGFNLDEAKQIVEQYRKIAGLDTSIKLTDDDIYSIMTKNLGLTVNWTSTLAQAEKNSEQIAETQAKIDELTKTSLDTLAEKSADAQKRYLSGDITKKMRDSLIAAAKATDVLDNRLITFFKMVADTGNPILAQFESQAAQIPGLENLIGKNADEAAALMITWLNSMNITGKGATDLTARVVGLITAINNLPSFKQILIAVQTQFNIPSFKFGFFQFGPENLAKYFQNQQTKSVQDQINAIINQIKKISSGTGGSTFKIPKTGGGGGGGSLASGPDVSELDLPDEIANASNRTALIAEAIKRARALQHLIPGADKEAKNDIVELLKGTQRILEVRGIKDDYLRKALEELADVEKKRLEFETKADTIRRIQVGNGSFAAIANVPLNSQTGVSVGGPQGPITINLNLNGQVLTPAQFAALADQIAAAIKKQLAG